MEMIRPGDDIHFLGAFPHSRLGEVFSGIDILVVPSQWHENNPRVIQESFASKTPVIASDVGGIAEFVKHGVNGLLFQRDQAKELTQKIEQVVMTHRSSSRCKREYNFHGLAQMKSEISSLCTILY